MTDNTNKMANCSPDANAAPLRVQHRMHQDQLTHLAPKSLLKRDHLVSVDMERGFIDFEHTAVAP